MINEKNAKSYCCDDISKIENYELAIADSKKWCCHHRWELTLDGEFACSSEDLKRLGMYYKRPYFELIFLPISEHRRIHNHKGMSDDARKKISIASSNHNAMKGKHHSDAALEKMRQPRGECFKGNVLWMEKHTGDNNVSRRADVRQKITLKNKARHHFNRTHAEKWCDLTKQEKQEYCLKFI